MSVRRIFNTLKWSKQSIGFFVLGFSISALTAMVLFYFNAFERGPLKEARATRSNHSNLVNSEYLQQLVSLRQQVASLDSSLLDSKISMPPENRNKRSEANAVGNKKNSEVLFFPTETKEAFKEVTAIDKTLYLPTGSVFRAQLITPIKTSVQESFVMAQVTNEYRIDADRKIEKDSRLIGVARLNPILKGVIVRFNRIVDPAGIEHSISSIALSEDALPEVEGLYVSDDAERYGTALAFGFIGGYSEAAKSRTETVFGSFEERSLANQVLSGLSTASFRVAEELLQDIREEAVEYVIVPAGVRVFVALTDRFMISSAK